MSAIKQLDHAFENYDKNLSAIKTAITTVSYLDSRQRKIASAIIEQLPSKVSDLKDRIVFDFNYGSFYVRLKEIEISINNDFNQNYFVINDDFSSYFEDLFFHLNKFSDFSFKLIGIRATTKIVKPLIAWDI